MQSKLASAGAQRRVVVQGTSASSSAPATSSSPQTKRRKRNRTGPKTFDRFDRKVDELTKEELEDHPYSSQPKFHLRCSFCSATHCSPTKASNGEDNCRRLKYQREKTPTREGCVYIRCHDKTTHLVDACPALHGRCPVCGCRGHKREDRCDEADPDVMEALFSDFELFADRGFYTRRRKYKHEPDAPAWGFFPLNATSARTLDYAYLKSISVMEAMKLVDSTGRLPAAGFQ